MNVATYEDGQSPRVSKGMFWRLLKQDAVRRSLRWSVPIALVLGLVLRTAGGDALRDWRELPFVTGQHEFIYMYVQLWLAVLFAVILAHFNSRCSSLSLGLPISPRTLWTTRVIAIAAAGSIPVAVLVVATAWADPTRSIGLDMPLLPLGARTAAGFVLAAVLFQLPSPGVHRIAGRKLYVGYVALVSVAVIIYSIATPGGWIWTAAPVLAAIAIGWIVGSRLPSGFDLAGAERQPAGAAPPAAAEYAGGDPFVYGKGRSRWYRQWRMLRIVWHENLNGWTMPVLTLLIYLVAWMLTALYYRVYHNPHEYVTLLLWCWVFICQSVRKLHRIDSLPISRNVIYYSAIAFMALPVGLGILTGYLVDYRLKDSPMTAVCFCDHTVRVPYDVWEVSWNGETPEVISPRGESYTPHATRVIKHWFDVTVYNPFEPGKKSSPEFVAFQIDRAVARVHSPEEVSPRVSDAAGDTSFVNAIKKGEYTVAASLRKDSDVRMRTNAIIVMLWCVMFLLVNSIWWRRYRPEASFVGTRWFAILIFGLPYAMLIAIAVLSAKGILNDWALVALQMITLRWVADAIPLGTGLLWTLTVAVGVASVYLLGRRYAKAEAPAPRSGKHLLSEY